MPKAINQELAKNPVGSIIAKVLAGSWRASGDDCDLSEAELSKVLPLLYQGGEAALAWWQIRNSKLIETATGVMLRDAYRYLRLADCRHRAEIKRAVSWLRADSIEPVLVKGWAIARRYPDSGLRPYGDIDLCVAPDQFRRAQQSLDRLHEFEMHFIDLHCGFRKLLEPATRRSGRVLHENKRNESDWNELYERSLLVALDELEIRIPSDEDHLRCLSLHLLASGAWRPLWLCDVALSVETRLPNFSWDRCLTANKRTSDWIAGAIGLAHYLLNLDLTNTPLAAQVKNLPRWLIRAVLRQWNRCRNPQTAQPAIAALLANLCRPSQIARDVYARWDNPIRARAMWNGQLNRWPPWPYQMIDFLSRMTEVPKQLGSLTRRCNAYLRNATIN